MPPRPAPLRRPPGLDADAIVTAALRLARDEGLAALSMRRLAETLDATPVALYRHVSDREDPLVEAQPTHGVHPHPRAPGLGDRQVGPVPAHDVATLGWPRHLRHVQPGPREEQLTCWSGPSG